MHRGQASWQTSKEATAANVKAKVVLRGGQRPAHHQRSQSRSQVHSWVINHWHSKFLKPAHLAFGGKGMKRGLRGADSGAREDDRPFNNGASSSKKASAL